MLNMFKQRMPQSCSEPSRRFCRKILSCKRTYQPDDSQYNQNKTHSYKLGSGLFGGEGFIMQKISGHGLAFLEFDGSVIEYVLQPGQQIVVDTGYLAAMEATCNMEIRTVPGIKNMMFGGEGLFNTVITGPGRVWLQTMPISNVAGAIMKVFPAR